jgi:hypothetical protein
MSGKVSAYDEPIFERWIIASYPDEFSEWELEYSEYMDLDCWIYSAHYEIYAIWLRHKRSMKDVQ